MNRTQHEPRFAVDGLSFQHFTVDRVTVRENLTETNTKSCHGEDTLNVEGCSETRTVVKNKTTTTVFKSPQQLRVVRPVDRLPLVFEGREQALLDALTNMKRQYKRKGNLRVKANVIAAQLEKLLDRFK